MALILGAAPQAGTDWEALTTSAVMSTRFDTEGEVLDYRLLDSASGNWSWDTSRKWGSNGSLRCAIPDASTENPGNWFRHLDDSFGLYTGSGGQAGGGGNSTDQGFDAPTTFEVARAIYIPATLRNTLFPNGGGWKTGIISHDGKSNNSFEVVNQNTKQRGYPQGYHRNPPDTTNIDEEITSTCGFASPDYNHQNEIDHGADALVNLAALNPDDSSAWSDCEKSWARWGGNFSYEGSSYADAASGTRMWKFWEQLDPEGASIGPVLYPADDWYVEKVRITLNSYSTATNRIEWFIGRRFHNDWVKIADQQNILLPDETDDFGVGFDKRYNTVWNTAFHTSRTGGGGVDTFINYGFVICRKDAGSIPFPQDWPAVTAMSIAESELSAGEWVTLHEGESGTDPNGIHAAFFSVNGDSPANGSGLLFHNELIYSSRSRRIVSQLGDHRAPQISVLYNEDTDSWSKQTGAGIGNYATGAQQHVYSEMGYDVVNDRAWYAQAGKSFESYDFTTEAWSGAEEFAGPSANDGKGGVGNRAATYWPGVGNVVWGLDEGCYIRPDSTGIWITVQSNQDDNWSTHMLAVYNPVRNSVIAGGGDDASEILYELTWDGAGFTPSDFTLTALATPPVTATLGAGGVLAEVDPISGDLVMFSGTGTMYSYDFGAGSWSAGTDLSAIFLQGAHESGIVRLPNSLGIISSATSGDSFRFAIYRHSA